MRTAAAVSRLHGAERRSFGTVSLLSILMLCKAAPFLYVAFLFLLFGGWLVERWYSRFIERWDSGYAWLVARTSPGAARPEPLWSASSSKSEKPKASSHIAR